MRGDFGGAIFGAVGRLDSAADSRVDSRRDSQPDSRPDSRLDSKPDSALDSAFFVAQRRENHYSSEELRALGFKTCGENVLISRLARIYGAEKIALGDFVRVDDFAILSGRVRLGSFVHISPYASIVAGESGAFVGDFSGLSWGARIFATSDDFTSGNLVGPTVPKMFRKIIDAKVVLEKHCHLGVGALVLPGSVLKIGASLGPLSLNLGRTLKPYGYYFGNPPRRIYELDAAALEARERELLSGKWGESRSECGGESDVKSRGTFYGGGGGRHRNLVAWILLRQKISYHAIGAKNNRKSPHRWAFHGDFYAAA